MDVITACIEDPAQLIFFNGNPLLVVRDGLLCPTAFVAIRALLRAVCVTDPSTSPN